MPPPINREGGTPGDDALTGEPGALNTLLGRAGDDTLTGAERDDFLDGGAGDDSLVVREERLNPRRSAGFAAAASIRPRRLSGRESRKACDFARGCAWGIPRDRPA